MLALISGFRLGGFSLFLPFLLAIFVYPSYNRKFLCKLSNLVSSIHISEQPCSDNLEQECSDNLERIMLMQCFNGPNLQMKL